jgi:hypothetical protein
MFAAAALVLKIFAVPSATVKDLAKVAVVPLYVNPPPLSTKFDAPLPDDPKFAKFATLSTPPEIVVEPVYVLVVAAVKDNVFVPIFSRLPVPLMVPD